MIRIMTNNADNFTLIQNALEILENENPEFMMHFTVAEEIPHAEGGSISVLLKNKLKFKADLNRNRKYVISVPESLVIDSFELVKTFAKDPRPPRRPITNVLVQAHLDDHDVNFLFLMNGFNNDNIRVVKPIKVTDAPDITVPDQNQDDPTNPSLIPDDGD